MTTDNDIKEKLAERRTESAMERTALARQRTFTAWLRTGITAVAGGLAVARLFHDFASPELIRTAGLLFIVSGAGAFLMALRCYKKKDGARDEGRGEMIWIFITMVVLLMAAAFLSVFILLIP